MNFNFLSIHLWRYIKVCLIGSIGAIIQLISLNLLHHLLSLTTSQLISIELAITSNFLLNNRISFFDRKIKQNNYPKKFALFNLFSLGSTFTQVALLHLSVYLLGENTLTINAATVAGIGLGSLVNYFVYNRYVWSYQ